jgi:hypothetical protein
LQAIIDVCQQLLDADAREAEATDDAVEEVEQAVGKSAEPQIEAEPEPEPVQVKAVEPAPKPKKKATVAPGEPGSLEYYRRKLQRHETFAIRNGIALSDPKETKADG